jgi:hypothetical protein
MSEYRLQVIFETIQKNVWTRRYRFAVIDQKKHKYPANFVCIFPKRIFDSGKPSSAFGRKFGKNSSEFAIGLLKDALMQEKDEKVKIELEKRLNALELERPKLTCCLCNKEFEKYSKVKYKRRLCKSCLELTLLQNQN